MLTVSKKFRKKKKHFESAIDDKYEVTSETTPKPKMVMAKKNLYALCWNVPGTLEVHTINYQFN